MLAGMPQRGQSHDAGTSASTENCRIVSWSWLQKYVTDLRGAASPRSASPMGPAPMRLPRIAPAAMSVAHLQQQAERDDADHPHRGYADGDAVEISLGNR